MLSYTAYTPSEEHKLMKHMRTPQEPAHASPRHNMTPAQLTHACAEQAHAWSHTEIQTARPFPGLLAAHLKPRRARCAEFHRFAHR